MIPLLLAACAIASPAAGEEQQCTASLRSVASQWPGGVPLVDAPETEVEVVVEQQGPCDAILVVDDSEVQLSGRGDARLPVRISAMPASWQPGMLEARSGNGTMRLLWRPAIASAPRAGSYAGSVPMRIEDRISRAVLAETVVDFSVEVPAELSVSRSDAPGSDVSLGSLSTGSRSTVSFSVSSNSAFSVSLASASGGRLVHDMSDAAIPYSTTVRPSGFSGVAGRPEPGSGSVGIAIEVPPSPAMPAGYYSDVLTVMFRAEQ